MGAYKGRLLPHADFIVDAWKSGRSIGDIARTLRAAGVRGNGVEDAYATNASLVRHLLVRLGHMEKPKPKGRKYVRRGAPAVHDGSPRRPGAPKISQFGDPCSKCGKPRDVAQYNGKRQAAWCKACRAEYAREWRKVNKMTPEQRRKDIARSIANVNLRRGKIKREPCKACGDEKAQMHHHDYSKPLEVEWLCRRCHLQEHYDTREAETVSPQDLAKIYSNHA